VRAGRGRELPGDRDQAADRPQEVQAARRKAGGLVLPDGSSGPVDLAGQSAAPGRHRIAAFPRKRSVMPRVALRYAQSMAAVCWQQAASEGYLVYLQLRGFVYALIGQVSPDREQPVAEFLRHATLYRHYWGDARS
jgi:hypothetical protein